MIIDRSYYGRVPVKGVQQRLSNFSRGMCNAIAIFQNAFHFENNRYATPPEEMEVVTAVVCQPAAVPGLPADRSSAFVTDHAAWLSWLKDKGFLKRDHRVVITTPNEAAAVHVVGRFQSRVAADTSHFVNGRIAENAFIVEQDGYDFSNLVAHGELVSVRYYPVK